MTGIEDHGADGRCVFDVPGAHDRLDDLGDIHCGNEDAAAFLNDVKTQDVFHIINENLSGARLAANAAVAAGYGEGFIGFLRGAEAVEFRDILDGDVATILMHHDIPSL
jgi:hypothetical protein